jgi:hypothetical protein
MVGPADGELPPGGEDGEAQRRTLGDGGRRLSLRRLSGADGTAAPSSPANPRVACTTTPASRALRAPSSWRPRRRRTGRRIARACETRPRRPRCARMPSWRGSGSWRCRRRLAPRPARDRHRLRPDAGRPLRRRRRRGDPCAASRGRWSQPPCACADHHAGDGRGRSRQEDPRPRAVEIHRLPAVSAGRAEVEALVGRRLPGHDGVAGIDATDHLIPDPLSRSRGVVAHEDARPDL